MSSRKKKGTVKSTKASDKVGRKGRRVANSSEADSHENMPSHNDKETVPSANSSSNDAIPARRSHRTRQKPLAHWLNERVITVCRSGKIECLNLDPGIKHSTVPEQKPEKKKAKSRKLKTSKSDAVPPKKGRKVHEPEEFASDDNASREGDSEFNSNRSRIPVKTNAMKVLDVASGNYVTANVVKPFKSLSWIPYTDKNLSGVEVSSILQMDNGMFGFLRIAGLKQKKRQHFGTRDMYFVVLKGTVDVVVHRSAMTLNAKDTFVVPRGNGYSIKNLNDSEALLVFKSMSN